MFEQPELAAAAPPAPSPWDQVRGCRRPGAVIVRVIAHEKAEQEFFELEGEGDVHRLLDGATVLRPAIPGQTHQQYLELVAEYDRRWFEAKVAA